MTAAPDDRAAFFDALRRSSARLLKLDADALSAAQAVRVDRCAALRLMLDQMQSAQLAGASIDAKSYISASAELERLLGGQPSAPTGFASSGSRDRLRALIEKTLLGADDAAAAADTLADTMRREEAIRLKRWGCPLRRRSLCRRSSHRRRSDLRTWCLLSRRITIWQSISIATNLVAMAAALLWLRLGRRRSDRRNAT